MNTLSISLLTLLGLAPAYPAAASSMRPAMAVPTRCAPAPKPAVPPDYLFYHGLVAPHAALSDRRPAQAACATRKVVRT